MTNALTERSIEGYDMQFAAQTFEAEDMAAAVELCFGRRWTDGLPVVPPTPGAVERIIAYLQRDPAEIVAIIPPRDGVATIEAIAINCVMAGCKPEYVPFVIAAVEAMQDEGFNLNGVQTTTHSCAPLVMVSGPAVKRLGFNTRECALGHGCRASATIGRAVRLILWNIGGGYPGEPCKTTHGHPGYFSFCVAEDAESNPWEPLHVGRGFHAEDTVVTVGAVEGPRLIGTGAGYSPVEDVLYMIADSIAALGCNTISGAEMVLVLAPMTARALAAANLSKLDVKRELMRLATRPVRDARRRRSIAESHPMHWSHAADPNDDDARVPFIRGLESVVIIVTGGWGSGAAFSSLCAGWGANRSKAVSRQVQFPSA
jgi:hypothetical protein